MNKYDDLNKVGSARIDESRYASPWMVLVAVLLLGAAGYGLVSVGSWAGSKVERRSRGELAPGESVMVPLGTLKIGSETPSTGELPVEPSVSRVPSSGIHQGYIQSDTSGGFVSYDRRRVELLDAMTKRILTRTEWAEVVNYGDMLNVEMGVPYDDARKSAELNRLYLMQLRLMLADVPGGFKPWPMEVGVQPKP